MRFDIARVERVVNFGRKFLRMWEGPQAGTPFTLMDWQHDELFGPLFGWVKWSHDYQRWVRRFTRVYCEIPKKGGKSPTGAYVGLYMFVGDQEAGAKVFSAATARDQASIVHGHAINFVENSPRLKELIRINRTTRVLSHFASKSQYAAISSNADAQEGLNANCIINDELHAWRGRALWDCLKYAFASRAEPILFSITTAGDDTESVCYEQHEYAKAVNRNEIDDPGFLGLIYAADPKDNFDDPKVWKKANPSLGTTISTERFAEDLAEAKRAPRSWNNFLRYRFDIWGFSEDGWLDQTKWLQCAEAYTDDDLLDLPCHAGLDLSQTRDVTALSLCFRDDDEQSEPVYRFKNYLWLPRSRAQEVAERVPYEMWEKQGYITLFDGEVIDYASVAEEVIAICNRFGVLELAYDPKYAEHLSQTISDGGVECVQFPQTLMHFTGPSKEFERCMIAGRLRHQDNAAINWQIRNVRVKSDANLNIRPVKPKHGDIRTIDGVVAMIMAMERSWRGLGLEGSFYDDDENELELI